MEKNLLVFLLAYTLPCLVFGENVTLPELPPFPDIPAPAEINSVKMGDSESFEEIKLDLPICPGPYAPSWIQ